MASARMTSMERVLTTLSHREPDRVPLFLLATMHGAKELGLSIRDYYSRGENVAEGQLRLLQKFGHDCAFPFFYAAVESEAWGGDVIYVDDGPPNSGAPLVTHVEQIRQLSVPRIDASPSLQKVLRAEELLKAKLGADTPIIGVVMSPFSLPVLQLGFDRYIELIYERRDLFEHLMRLNEEFCVEWANAQLRAGATAITYFDPVSSSTIIPKDLYLRTGYPVARRTIARIEGPTATHLASGRCAPIVDDIALSGTKIVGVGSQEDVGEIKRLCRGKLTVIGNLNGIEMRRWSAAHAEAMVKEAIAKGGPGGGFILADQHGEIPYQVSDDVLFAIAEAAREWGRYPLTWIEPQP